MRLHEFFTTAGREEPAPARPVKFKAMFKNQKDASQSVVEVSAVLAFVGEDERFEARRDAYKALRKEFPAGDIPAELLADEKGWRTLLLALRDEEDHRVQFASSLAELRMSMTSVTAGRLMAEYFRFLDEEFPEDVSKEDFDELVEEAKKNSLAALLSSGKSAQIQAAFPGLVAHFAQSQMQTSSDSAQSM